MSLFQIETKRINETVRRNVDKFPIRFSFELTEEQSNVFLVAKCDQKIEKRGGKYKNPSIGIILCRDKDKISVEYALKDISKPIGVSSYELSKYLSNEIIKELPTEEDINLHIML